MDSRKLRAIAPGGPAPCSGKIPVVLVIKWVGRPEKAEEWQVKAEVAAPVTRGVMLAFLKWPLGRTELVASGPQRAQKDLSCWVLTKDRLAGGFWGPRTKDSSFSRT